METVRVSVLVLTIKIDLGWTTAYRRHPTLVMFYHVVSLQGYGELGAKFGLERLHRRQGTGRENYATGCRFEFVKHCRRVQAQEANYVVPDGTGVFGRVAIEPSVHT